MRTFGLAIIALYLITGCGKAADMKEIFLKNQAVFKKIEDPVKTNERYVFEKSALPTNHSAFDSAYLASIKKVFLETGCDIAYIVDGDILIGHRRSLSKLLFTNKGIGDSIELLNFKGTLNYLLQSGNSKKPPYAIPISPKWYVVNDIESF